jgi:hypothetical protein
LSNFFRGRGCGRGNGRGQGSFRARGSTFQRRGCGGSKGRGRTFWKQNDNIIRKNQEYKQEARNKYGIYLPISDVELNGMLNEYAELPPT